MSIKDIERASLVGHSLGGGVALSFAIQYPDKIDKLVIEDSAGLGRETGIIFKLLTLHLIGELLSRPNLRISTLSMKTAFYYKS